MSVIQGNALGQDIDVGDIQNSLRFRAAGSTYLSKTFGSPTNRRKWTFNKWIKRGALGAQGLFGAQPNTTTDAFGFNASNQIYCQINNSNCLTTTAVFRDPTSHFMLTIAVDTTQATAANRVKVYINGTQLTSHAVTPSDANIPQNTDGQINASGAVGYIGRYCGSGGAITYGDFYDARDCFVDGSQLDPSSFGYLNTEINEWVSKSQSACKAVVDAGGTNSFMLDFDTSSLGNDFSSKNNDWTSTGHSTTAGTTCDWPCKDVPGNSFATLSPLAQSPSDTCIAGNLDWTTAASSTRSCTSTISVSSGVWYWEVTPTGTYGAYNILGIIPDSINAASANSGPYTNGYGYLGTNGYKYVSGSASAYGATFASNDVIGVLLDLTNNQLTFYKQTGGSGNFASQGSISISAGTYKVGMSTNTSSATASSYNFGQLPLGYVTQHGSLPSSAKALCQANLPDNGTVIVSGTFTGNGAVDGPFVWINGVPKTLTINSNAVTFGTHADKTAGGFKLRTTSASYNTAGSNTFTATIDSDIQNIFKYNSAEANP